MGEYAHEVVEVDDLGLATFGAGGRAVGLGPIRPPRVPKEGMDDAIAQRVDG